MVAASNETQVDLRVFAGMRGQDGFETESTTVHPGEERVLIKYEEPLWSVTPVDQFIHRLRVITPGDCTVTMDRATVQRAASREKSRRWWSIHMTRESLESRGCPIVEKAGDRPPGTPSSLP